MKGRFCVDLSETEKLDVGCTENTVYVKIIKEGHTMAANIELIRTQDNEWVIPKK